MKLRGLKILIVITGIALIYLFVMLFGSIKKEEDEHGLTSKASFQIREDISRDRLPDFQFVNQFGETVNQNNFKNKIYVADFFFTSCPTICPIMARNKIQIQEAFQDNDDVLLLSHSIDVQSDSIPVLLEYSKTHGAIPNKWHMVTGQREAIYEVAKEYYVMAQEDDRKSGSFIHDGSFILVDGKGSIQGIYDGTDSESTEALIQHIEILSNK